METLIDCHAHLAGDMFSEDLQDVLGECKDSNIRVIAVGMTFDDFQSTIDIRDKFYPSVYLGLGLHPCQKTGDCSRPLTVADTSNLREWIKLHNDSLVCLGEAGLDFSTWLCPTSSEREGQKRALIEQIKIAKEFDLPLNLHSRSAGRPLLTLLREQNAAPCLLHAFDGSKKVIKAGVADGHYFSVAPSITRDPSQVLVASTVPRDRVVLESDAPALGPVKQVRNTPNNLLITVKELADLWGCSQQEVARITTQNALRLFPRIKL